MQTKRQKTAIFLLCCVFFVTLFSTLLTATTLIHESENGMFRCTDECPFCAALIKAEKALDSLSDGKAAEAVAALVAFVVVFVIAERSVMVTLVTLVKLKVKMTD